MNIYEKMSKITEELQTVAKNLTVDTGKGKGYKAVSERDVIDAVKPLEAKYGVYSYPADREILQAETLSSETQYGVKTTFFTRVKTTYRFVNCEKPDEYIETTTFAEGIDSQDKGSGKAMTYADKYALMKAYKISTGDDPDANASEPENYKQVEKQKVKADNVTALKDKLQRKKVPMGKILEAYGVTKLEDLNMEQWLNAMRRLDKNEG